MNKNYKTPSIEILCITKEDILNISPNTWNQEKPLDQVAEDIF